MSLELSPEIENTVRERAAAEGVSVNDLLARTFAPVLTPPLAPQDTQQNTPQAVTDAKAHVLELIAKRQAEDNTPQYPPLPTQPGETPLGALFREWAEEDAKMTEEEVAAAQRLWEEHKKGSNETRRALGMRTLF